MSDYAIDEALNRRILARVGLEGGKVEIREEYVNLGFCETCDYPLDGFSVHVNGEQVWPSDEFLREFGGIASLDEEGYVKGDTLSSFGQFNNWLNNEPLLHDDDRRS